MGKKGSVLVPFLMMGLEQRLYEPYLKYVDEKDKTVMRITLPRKSSSLDSAAIQLLKDWCTIKKRKYVDYSKVKSGLVAALRKSDYLEHIADSKFPLTYRLLNSEEVKGKKYLKKKKFKDINCYSPLSVDSGYNSYSESSHSMRKSEMSPCSPHNVLLEEPLISPSNDQWMEKKCLEYDAKHHTLPAIMHDHWFSSTYHETTGEQVSLSTSSNVDEDTQNFDCIEELCDDLLTDLPLTDSQWENYLAKLLEDYDINFDMLVTNSEEKKQLDDLMKDLVTNDLDMENTGVNSEIKEYHVKVYKYKEEIFINENLIMMIFECEDKDQSGKHFGGRQLLFDLDLLSRVQAYKLINNVCIGHYWQLFFKPLKAGVN